MFNYDTLFLGFEILFLRSRFSHDDEQDAWGVFFFFAGGGGGGGGGSSHWYPGLSLSKIHELPLVLKKW